MIYPIRAYGDPVLRKVSREIDRDYPDLEQLIESMFETMDASDGVGLAAPQIGLDIRLFVVDSSHFEEKDPGEKGIRKAFINATMLNEEGKEWSFEEGCLSIPDIRENILRKPQISVRYLDKDFVEHTETFSGLTARVIQHEYDHIEGKLFVDYLSPLKKQLLKSKLGKISKGEVNVRYRMKFPKRK